MAGIDRLAAVYASIDVVRRGGTVSLSGVYAGEADILPMKTMFDKQITLRMGQCNVKRWVDDLLPLVEDPSDPLGVMDLVTHHAPLEDAPRPLRDLPEEGGRLHQGCPSPRAAEHGGSLGGRGVGGARWLPLHTPRYLARARHAVCCPRKKGRYRSERSAQRRRRQPPRPPPHSGARDEHRHRREEPQGQGRSRPGAPGQAGLARRYREAVVEIRLRQDVPRVLLRPVHRHRGGAHLLRACCRCSPAWSRSSPSSELSVKARAAERRGPRDHRAGRAGRHRGGDPRAHRADGRSHPPPDSRSSAASCWPSGRRQVTSARSAAR